MRPSKLTSDLPRSAQSSRSMTLVVKEIPISSLLITLRFPSSGSSSLALSLMLRRPASSSAAIERGGSGRNARHLSVRYRPCVTWHRQQPRIKGMHLIHRSGVEEFDNAFQSRSSRFRPCSREWRLSAIAMLTGPIARSVDCSSYFAPRSAITPASPTATLWRSRPICSRFPQCTRRTGRTTWPSHSPGASCKPVGSCYSLPRVRSNPLPIAVSPTITELTLSPRSRIAASAILRVTSSAPRDPVSGWPGRRMGPTVSSSPT
jgi:hypothetical protein